MVFAKCYRWGLMVRSPTSGSGGAGESNSRTEKPRLRHFQWRAPVRVLNSRLLASTRKDRVKSILAGLHYPQVSNHRIAPAGPVDIAGSGRTLCDSRDAWLLGFIRNLPKAMERVTRFELATSTLGTKASGLVFRMLSRAVQCAFFQFSRIALRAPLCRALL